MFVCKRAMSISLRTDVIEYHVTFSYTMTRKKYAKLARNYSDAHGENACFFDDVVCHVENECRTDDDIIKVSCDLDHRDLPYVYLQMKKTEASALECATGIVADVNHDRHRWNHAAVPKLQTLIRRACTDHAFLAHAVVEGVCSSGRDRTEVVLSVLLPQRPTTDRFSYSDDSHDY